ncbi:MarR family winged helix-turn-helix transcriptional regulator [Cohnella mopanensis]|uniref:MarR family winged helix-turn-helix transcriptional regulator n=1 Tax=Cohnella mopanensis TaxID=2911966 RepID=UPI001EF8F110|nr:MarR family transcriptional regulator [Cohnella mopanensis]
MKSEITPETRRLIETFERFAKADWRRQSIQRIKPSELRVLMRIREISRENDQGVMVSEISRRLAITSPTVTQIIKSLHTNGYIEKAVDARDRRVSDIRLSEAGEQIVDKMGKRIEQAFTGLIEKLGKEQSETLIVLLDQVFEYFDKEAKHLFD